MYYEIKNAADSFRLRFFCNDTYQREQKCCRKQTLIAQYPSGTSFYFLCDISSLFIPRAAVI